MDYNHAFIFGIGGQDGSYLAEFLLAKGYNVHGFVRRSSVDNLWRIKGIRDQVTLHRGDLTDAMSVHLALEKFYCTNDADRFEVYNLADQDEVAWSNDVPGYSWDVTFGAVGRMLDSIHRHNRTATKVFQPLSATMFGFSSEPMNLSTEPAPCSPYAVAKQSAWNVCRFYREKHNIHVCCGVLFNHESTRRGPNYLLQTLARQAVEVARDKRDCIEVLSAEDRIVDVGWAPDFVAAMWASLQQGWNEVPDDVLIGTGLPTTVGQWAEGCLAAAGAPRGRVRYGKQKGDMFADAKKNQAVTKWLRTSPEDICRRLVGHWLVGGIR